MMRLTKLELHNYLSFKDATLHLDKRGLTMIAGENNSNDTYNSNGAGKSSLLSGITYALYGKTVENVSGDAIINKQAGTDCHVYLEFYIGKTKYRIERYRKGKKNNRNKVKLFANDNEITLATNAKTEEEIQHLVNIPYDTYVNTVMYGQGDVPVFSQATDKGKKEILETLANTYLYAKARDVSADKQKEYENTLDKYKIDLENKKSSLETTIQYQKTADENYKLAMQRKNEYKAEYLEASKSKKQKESQLEQEKLVLSRITTETSNKRRALPNYQSIQNEYNQLNSKYISLSSSIKNNQLTGIRLQEQLKDLDTQKICPTCGQVVTNEHKEVEKKSLTSQLVSVLQELQQQIKSKEELEPQLQQVKKQLDALSSQSNDILNSNRKLDAQVQAQSNKVNAVQRDIDIISANMQALDRQIKEPVAQQYFTGNISKLKDEIKALEEHINSTDKQIEIYKTLAGKVFSRQGIQSMAMDLIVPFLNEHANTYLSKLSGSVLQINMSTQTLNANSTLSDKFDLQVSNASGADSYTNCSAGERKRIDIAIAFAIQDLLNSDSNRGINVAVYDECFDGLDAIGAENVISIMQDKQKEVGTIFVITHNSSLSDLFDNIITVSKGANGISVLEDEK